MTYIIIATNKSDKTDIRYLMSYKEDYRMYEVSTNKGKAFQFDNINTANISVHILNNWNTPYKFHISVEPD